LKENKMKSEIIKQVAKEMGIPVVEMGLGDPLRISHFTHCRAEGMTDDQIEKDWSAFEADYEAWLDARPEAEEEVGGGDRCAAAARDIGLPQAFAETCENRQHGCPNCPFRNR
jgi:hypothetical protein